MLPDFPGDAMTARGFLEYVAPKSERRSEPYLRYQMFTPRYVIYRNLNTFDLRENRQLGPSFAARVGYGIPVFGADLPALSFSASAAWAIGPAGWFGWPRRLSGQRRRHAGTPHRQTATGRVYLATPVIAGLGRLILSAQTSMFAATPAARFTTGRQPRPAWLHHRRVSGTTMAMGNVELRTAPVACSHSGLGAVVFYDVGGADAPTGSCRPTTTWASGCAG